VRTTWRLALDHRRGEKRRELRHRAHGLSMLSEPHHPDATARSMELWAALDRLPEKLRITMVLSAIDGHDISEVARLLALPEGTVKSRLFHARRLLKERL
jgi:RNA polymerase sigma factor (sigma-70 family)